MKTIAVTGATGFVGGFVASYLEGRGYKVVRFGRKEQGGVVYWDITKGSYERDVELDAIVHCAASVDDWASYEDSYAVNVTGTKNVLRSFPNVSTFIYISSASVYDPFCKEKVIFEETCVGGKSLNAYSKTKLLGEREVLASSISSRIILRPHIIYGPGDTTVGPRFRKGIRFGYFIVPGTGTNLISFTHVENLAGAVAQALALSPKGPSVYNITDLEAVTLEDALAFVRRLNNIQFKEIHLPRPLCFVVGNILEAIYSSLGISHAPLLTRYLAQQMTGDHILDISKAQRELQYNPSRTVKKDLLL